MLIGIVYKLINKNGFLYVKADGGNGFTNVDLRLRTLNPVKFLKRAIKRCLYANFVKSVNLISVETQLVYNQFASAKMYGIDMAKKTRLLYNGFDMEQFLEYDFRIKDISEKENIIITVGRLGTKQKNTEMLLNAASELNLKNWKLVLIGPIEKTECNFQESIDDFYAKHPNLRETIVFTGPIYDKKELWDWYNKAKVFVLPSRSEGFAIVFAEAVIFRNYVISTDVGGASEMVNPCYGEIIPQENDQYFARVLQEIIDENNLEQAYKKVDWANNDISWEKFIRDATADFFVTQPV
jgi:glycosyltransferase involved in cell wall biosynthesis